MSEENGVYCEIKYGITKLFNCKGWSMCKTKELDSEVLLVNTEQCIYEKIMVWTAFVLMLIMIQQVVIYIKFLNVGFCDGRVQIYVLSILSAINIFWHYDLSQYNQAKNSVFVIYVMAYSIYLLIGSFFVSRAGKLVGNKKAVRLIIIIFGVSMFTVISGGGLYFIIVSGRTFNG